MFAIMYEMEDGRVFKIYQDLGHGLIAVIEDDICIEEITFEEVSR